MKRALFSLTFFAVLLGAGWYYIPSQAQKIVAGIIGGLLKQDMAQVKDSLSDVTRLLPSNVASGKRAEAISELKNNATAIQNVINKARVDGKPLSPEIASLEPLLASSASVADELINLSEPVSAPERLVENIIQAVLPQRTNQSLHVCPK